MVTVEVDRIDVDCLDAAGLTKVQTDPVVAGFALHVATSNRRGRYSTQPLDRRTTGPALLLKDSQ